MTRHYTVKEMARRAGVSVRTLHHYDQVGLLHPVRVGGNGYRYYGDRELERLLAIVAYRELGMPLAGIGALLARDGAGRIAQLEAERQRLLAEADRARQQAADIERSIVELTGDQTMKHADLYRAPTAREQARYRKEAAARFGEETVARSEAAWQGAGAPEQQERLAELGRIEAGLAACCRDGVPLNDAGLAALLERHRAWVALMWGRACPLEAYAGLAQVYRDTPAFRDRYNTLAEGMADYLTGAMLAHAGGAT